MSALSPPGAATGGRGLHGVSPGVRRLTLFPILALFAIAAELVYLSGPYTGPDTWHGADIARQMIFSYILLAWNGSIPAALVALIILTGRFLPQGMPVALATEVLFSGAVVAAMIHINVSDSSVSPVLLVFLPIYLFFALLPLIGLTWLVHRLRARPLLRR